MAIRKVPSQFPTMTAALENVAPGDLILVGPGRYPEEILVSVNNISIVAEQAGTAILDGAGRLDVAFSLMQVAGALIEGFVITGYREAGIKVQGGGYHRLVGNRIRQIKELGISLAETQGTLLWRNLVVKVGKTGIQVSRPEPGAPANWIVENRVARCGAVGIETFGPDDGLIGNWVKKCGHGISAHGLNQLLFANRVTGPAQIGIDAHGAAPVLLRNAVRTEPIGAVEVGIAARNVIFFLGQNESTGHGVGIELSKRAQYGASLENQVRRNRSAGGIHLRPDASANLWLRNEARRNRPVDVVDPVGGNAYVQNDCLTSNPPQISEGGPA
jgi:hypothetical protein